MQKPKTKIQPRTESVIHITQPVVRDFSTAGGHGLADFLMENGIRTKKWQGYPPVNLNVIGKPLTPIASNPYYTNGGEIPTAARGSGIQTIDGFKTRAPFFSQVDAQAAYVLKLGGA